MQHYTENAMSGMAASPVYGELPTFCISTSRFGGWDLLPALSFQTPFSFLQRPLRNPLQKLLRSSKAGDTKASVLEKNQTFRNAREASKNTIFKKVKSGEYVLYLTPEKIAPVLADVTFGRYVTCLCWLRNERQQGGEAAAWGSSQSLFKIPQVPQRTRPEENPQQIVLPLLKLPHSLVLRFRISSYRCSCTWFL